MFPSGRSTSNSSMVGLKGILIAPWEANDLRVYASSQAQRITISIVELGILELEVVAKSSHQLFTYLMLICTSVKCYTFRSKFRIEHE